MKYFFSTLLILLACNVLVVAQQTTLRVQLTVNKNDSFPPASLELFLLPDTTPVSSQVAVQNGNSFPVNQFSKYLLVVSSAGYAATEKIISVTNKPLALPVPLKKAVKGMDEVVVRSRRPLVRQEDDKQVIDADPLATTSSNAYEILEKTPGAIVDQDGNVYLSSMTCLLYTSDAADE